MRIPFALLAFASSCVSALALDLKGRIQWTPQCPSLKELGQAKVVLDDGKMRGGVTRDGSFTMYMRPCFEPPPFPLTLPTDQTYQQGPISSQSYRTTTSLTKYSPSLWDTIDPHTDHLLPQLRVDVFQSDTLPEVRPYFPGTPLSPAAPATLPYPIVLSARGRADYFVPHESFNILAMFQNPMMMMMLGAGVLVLLMPTIMVRPLSLVLWNVAVRTFKAWLRSRMTVQSAKLSPTQSLQKNMDPEALEEFKERHAKMTNIQGSLQSGDLASG
ncbi:hypothetical protein BN946_scf184977.g15 [Trametes cinnabarina]|uniref:ER membrane protein complex subunit 7 beta-sandwich domain-containing protein n=1 Tax=Pycnoporus cinnabarinus TaxID=5643 RepID=A0A060SIT1_PYCCI|nr:hypothetical protein BN946_scf184977.g15 [Trametes cinnabarina]